MSVKKSERGVASFQRIDAAVILTFAAFFLFLSSFSSADLPIHATVSDMKGLWEFSLSPPFRGTVTSCGSTVPNKNTANLRPEMRDFRSFMETHGGISTHLRLKLSDTPVEFGVARSEATMDSPHRRAWNTMGVYDGSRGDSLVGSWTSVYDEGFEVDIGQHTRMMGLLKYFVEPSCNKLPRDGDLEDSSGNTLCYATDPTKLQMGWYYRRQKDGPPLYGCFYAEKKKAENHEPYGIAAAAAFVMVDESKSFSFLSGDTSGSASLDVKQLPSKRDLTYYTSSQFIDSHNDLFSASWRARVNPLFAQLDSSSLSRYIKDLGFKKIRGHDDYESVSSFLQARTASLPAKSALDSTQIYACPCKQGEQALDTRRTKSPDQKVQILSPVSELEIAFDRNILASITAHDHVTASEEPADVGLLQHQEQLKFKTGDPAAAASPGLPKNFSWADPFSNNRFDDPVGNQGLCGSCYALAATYALQKRFEIAASKMLGKDVKLFGKHASNVDAVNAGTSFVDLEVFSQADGELSAQGVISCSFLNQGCDGGFPYLVGKHAREIGLFQESCMGYTAKDSERCPLDFNQKTQNFSKDSVATSEQPSFIEAESRSKACMADSRWYASNYGYVGGCYECNHCSGEQLIMDEIYHNGPVAAAFDAPPSLFAYGDGIFDLDEESARQHSRVCDSTNVQGDRWLTGWEYTNHAVVLSGWGEEINPHSSGSSPTKYWIVRNTWGPSWGNNGYFKLAKGKNLGGIESQATWIDPDFTRGRGLQVKQKIDALKQRIARNVEI